MAKSKAAGAARFTSRYTGDQKQAILRAVLIEGNTVAQAIELAEAGQLGLPAFKVGVYAYDIVKKGRDAFEADHEDALTAAVAREMRTAELNALATIRAIQRNFTRDGKGDTSSLARATKDLAAIRRARKETMVQTTRTKTKAAPVQTNDESNATPEATNVITSLLSKTEQGGKSGSISRAPNGSASSSAA